MLKNFQTWLSKLQPAQPVGAITVLAVAIIGSYWLISGHAATPYVSVSAGSGSPGCNASTQTDSQTGGQYVKFGSGAPCGGGGSGGAMPIVVGHQLQTASGTPLKMRGVVVWGMQDSGTNINTFGTSEYTNRQTVINTLKAWGVNVIRFRLLASYYDGLSPTDQAQQIQHLKDWQSAAQAAGMYLDITWWDSLDGPYGQANWASNYKQAFPMMGDVIKALGPTNPWVVYEPFNEPDNVSEGSWLAAMQDTVKQFRADQYNGVLVLDTDGWSHVYNDADMTSLEQTDAGLVGKSQLIFAKHDYANEHYANPDSSFDSTHWAANAGGGASWDFSKHLVWETEFGNYNGDPSTVHLAWSAGAATWMAQKVNDGTLVGATAFLYGPWYDANAITQSDNVTPTTWGGYVKTNFLANVH